MARVPVNPTTVSAYLIRRLTAGNYQLFYGLMLLPDAEYSQVWDGLLNGDCQPEELVRLGSFSQAEADAFIQDVLGDWANPGVAQPTVGTPGYAYLTVTLGLSSLLLAVSDPGPLDGPDPGQFLGVRYLAGSPGDPYPSVVALGQIFEAKVLTPALAGQPFGAVFPGGPDDVAAFLLAGNTDGPTIDLIQQWYASLFGQLTGVSPYQVGTTLFVVNGDLSGPLQSCPGLAQWLLSEPSTPPSTRLVLLRESAVRSANGPYSKAEAAAKLAELQASPPGPVGTSRAMAQLCFWPAALAAASTQALEVLPGDADWTSYLQQAQALYNAYAAICEYRNALRAFCGLAYAGAATYLQGEYPPG